MPKILYVEDELTKNISTIKRFFAPYLNKKRIVSKLDELDDNLANSERVVPEDIVSACKLCSLLDISYTFPDALQKITATNDEYDLIIIDRNLSMWDYLEESSLEIINECLNKVGLLFDEDRKLEFSEREGDLLLLVLLKINPDYGKKVFYMTANTKDDLKGSKEIQTFLDVGSFYKEQVVEKGCAGEEEKLIHFIENVQAFQIENQYRVQCSILRKHLNEEVVSRFITMINHQNSNNHRDFLSTIRNVLESLLDSIANNINDLPDELRNQNGSLVYSSFIRSIDPMRDRHKLGYNSIIRNSCFSIYKIASDYGSHTGRDITNVTIHTVEGLKQQILDVILWFDFAIKRIEEIRDK